MNPPRASSHSNLNGFTILELVAVVTVLGILSSISIPLIGDIVKSSKIDSVKAKFNSAAAFCLQDIRSGSDPTERISPSIISDELLQSDGYKLSPDMSSCSSLMAQGLDEDDVYFFPLGFTITDGRLTKFAFPLSQDNDQGCKSWAGSNCKAGEELLDLIAHNKAVEGAKTKCNEEFYSWLNGNPPVVPAGDGKRNRWDPEADSACKRVPPANKGDTCTPNGCTLETWAFEGTIVAGEDGYKEALERKYGKICSEKLAQKLQEKYTGGPENILECGANKKLWFFEGVDQGSEAEMNKLICEKKQSQHEDDRTTGTTTISECGDKKFFYCLGDDKGTENLMTDCIGKNKEAGCQNKVNEAFSSDYEGKFVAEAGGPGVCSKVHWVCKNEDVGSEAEFNKQCTPETCSMDRPPLNGNCGDSQYWGNQTCITWLKCLGLM